MKIRERVENNLVIWLLATLFTGFIAGIGTYGTILDIAQLEVISRAELEALQHDLGSTLEDPNSRPSPTGNDSSPNMLQAQASGFVLSDYPPFPEGLGSVKPGMALSTAKSVFPNGELRSGAYVASLESDVFTFIAFLVDSRGQDPRIRTINIFLRDEYPTSSLLALLLRELDEWPHRAEMLGERLVWPNINGYRLEVEGGTYAISATVEDERSG